MTADPFAAIQSLISQGQMDRAVAEARKWLIRRPNDRRVQLNVGGVLIDAGHNQDPSLVREGVELCKSARERATTPEDRLSATYNLANGLLALHDMAGGQQFLAVRYDDDLQRVASLYYEVIDESERVGLQARVNFATVLQRQSRTVEAMDLVQAAVAEAPDFAPAWSTLADVAWGVFSFYSRDRDLLLDAYAAYRHARSLRRDDLPYQASVGENMRRLEALIQQTATPSEKDEQPGNHLYLIPSPNPWTGDLDEFVWGSGLGLNFRPGRREGRREYDRFPVQSFLVSTSDLSSFDELAAEVNLLVQSYVGARLLLWLSRAPEAEEVEVIRHPVPGTTFSRRAMFLAAGFREAYGLLDRVAALLNRHLHLGLPTRKAYFDRLLFRAGKDDEHVFRSELALPASPGLRALLFLSASFEFGAGRFNDLRQLRNHLQHSLVIPTTEQRPTFGAWTAVTPDTLERRLFQMLRLSRAAIFYAAEVFQSLDRPVLAALRELGVSVPRFDVDPERRGDRG